MSDISRYLDRKSRISDPDYNNLFRKFSSKFGTGLPNFEKNEQLREDFFNYSIDFAKTISIEYIEQYHNWLLENYDLKPKY